MLILSFLSYESGFRLSAYTEIAFAKPFSVLLPGVAKVPHLVRKFHTTCGSSAQPADVLHMSESSGHDPEVPDI